MNVQARKGKVVSIRPSRDLRSGDDRQEPDGGEIGLLSMQVDGLVRRTEAWLSECTQWSPNRLRLSAASPVMRAGAIRPGTLSGLRGVTRHSIVS